MKYFKRILTIMMIIALIAGLSACKEGPLESAGKKVDRAVDDIKN